MRAPSLSVTVLVGLFLLPGNAAPVAAQCSNCRQCSDPQYITTQGLTGLSIAYLNVSCWQEETYNCEWALPCWDDDDDALLADLSAFIEEDDRLALRNLIAAHPLRFQAVPERGVLLMRTACGSEYHALRELSPGQFDIVLPVLGTMAWVPWSRPLRGWSPEFVSQ